MLSRKRKSFSLSGCLAKRIQPTAMLYVAALLLSVSETSQCSKCIGSKYPAESQQIIVCRSQRQGPIGDNMELRCSASRLYRSLAVAYPVFFSWLLPGPPPPPAHLFFRRQRDWAGPIWKPPFRPVADTPLLVFCCLSYILKKSHYPNLLSRVLS